MFNSGNPALNDKTFDQFGMAYGQGDALTAERPDAMTVMGTVWKTMLLLLAVVAAGTFTWNMTMTGSGNPMPWMLGGAIGGFVVALVTIFKPAWSPFTAPVYAVLEGLFLGAVSAFYEASYGAGAAAEGGIALNGIVVQAVGLTLGVMAAMLILYATRIIRVTAKLRAGIMIAIGGVFLYYIAWFVGSLLFGVDLDPIKSAGPLSIGISLLIIGIASFTFLLNFDTIERGAQQGAPKYMEWYGAFGLLVTLVWLYLEILRLLAKLQNRD